MTTKVYLKHAECGQTALIFKRKLKHGEVISEELIEKPVVKNGDNMLCMNCGDIITKQNLNDRYISETPNSLLDGL